jgi:hypothetical protein
MLVLAVALVVAMMAITDQKVQKTVPMSAAMVVYNSAHAPLDFQRNHLSRQYVRTCCATLCSPHSVKGL